MSRQLLSILCVLTIATTTGGCAVAYALFGVAAREAREADDDPEQKQAAADDSPPSEEAESSGAESSSSSSSSSDPYAELCPDMDTSSMPHDADEHEVEDICKHGTEELMADYKELLRTADERDWDSTAQKANYCIGAYIDVTRSLDKGEEPRGGFNNSSYFSLCSRHCGGTAERDDGRLGKIAARYDEKCTAAKKEWDAEQTADAKPDFRKSLEAFVEAMNEERWPLYLHRQYSKAQTLLDQARDNYGEDDEMVQTFESKLEAIEQGSTGQKLERARNFRSRDDVMTIFEELSSVRTDMSITRDEIDTEEFRAESGSGHSRERARRELRKLRQEMRDLEARHRNLRERFTRKAIDAGLYPSDAEFSPGYTVGPGDTPDRR